MRMLIIGNSGSGKSTYAAAVSREYGIPHLDLDSIVWEPKHIALPRSASLIEQDLLRFTAAHAEWVVVGCYGELAHRLLYACTELIFLNPGEEICLRNNRSRPWEPHKYSSAADQQRMLHNLLSWVAGYYTRQDAWSYTYHRRIFDAFPGAKQELSSIPPPRPQTLAAGPQRRNAQIS